ncbi:alpha/beta hydrolase fold domain-containing protein [Pedococcus sp. P5_B7]
MRTIVDKAEIRDALERVARGVSRADSDLIRSGYHEPSWEEHGGFRGTGQQWADLPWRESDDRKMMHIGLLQTVIDFAETDVAFVETFFIAHARTGAPISSTQAASAPETDADDEYTSIMIGRYLDRFERVDGEWRIRVRRVVLDEAEVGVAVRDNPLLTQFPIGDRYPVDPLYDRDRLALPDPRNKEDAMITATPPYPPVPFDPELEAALPALHAVITPDGVQADTIEKYRADIPGVITPSDDDISRGGAFVIEHRVIPGPASAPDISLLICQPAPASIPVAAIYYVHGGGMVLGDNRTGLLGAIELAEAENLAVVSVEYRLAPETPHPGPVEDCYAGLVWLADHAAELGIDPDRIIICGVSAGGGLAAATTLLARDRGGPNLFGQLLMCPMLDDRNNTPSATQMVGRGAWDRSSNLAGWTALLGAARGSDNVSPYASPARALDLANLPPTFIDVGSAETFRDEDVLYASRIWQAGGRAELHVWPGGYHGFDSILPDAVISRHCRKARRNWLSRLLTSAL